MLLTMKQAFLVVLVLARTVDGDAVDVCHIDQFR